MTTKIWAAVMVVFTLIYAALLGQKGLLLIGTGEPIAFAMGVAILVFPIFAIWIVYVELRFGFKGQALAKKATSLGIPELELEFRASGRATKESAQTALDPLLLVSEAEADWAHFLRLGQAYDAFGERKKARAAIRRAISLADNSEAL